MTRPLDIEVANFVCRFGTQYVLNDLLEEVVLPAFFRPDAREYGETKYFFAEQDFRYLQKNNDDSLALQCRFIKSTVLRRHQIYDPSHGLRADESALESAPSALAILLLNSHRLLYIREVPHAPTPIQFGSTFAHLLRLSMTDFHNALYLQGRHAGRKPSKKSLRAKYPFPEVDVVPVVSSDSLKQFVRRFDTLNTLKIEVAPTNSELDNSEFFKMLRASKEDIASKKTTIQHQNAKGLDKTSCVNQVEAAKQGNARIFMKGVDNNGDELKGNNESFSVRASLEEAGEQMDARAADAYEKYEELVEKKVVTLGSPSRDDSKKLREIYEKFQRRKAEE